MNNNDHNTAIGSNTLQNNTADDNTAVGYFALQNNTSGTANTSCGKSALTTTRTGSQNCAFGFQALNNNDDGIGNTAVGYSSLGNIISGTYNTAIGKGAGPSGSSINYSGSFGYNASPVGSGKIKIGDNAEVSWIGGHSAWNNTSDGRFKRNVKEDVPGLDFILQLHPVTFQWNNLKLERFVGVPDSVLNNVNEAGRALAQKNEQKICTGFIAQEVEKAAQNINYKFDGVYHPQNDHDVYSLAYAEFVVPLVKAVQEQQKIITKQQHTIDEMQKMMTKMQKELNKIKENR